MKKVAFFALVAAGFFVASCAGSEETADTNGEAENQDQQEQEVTESAVYTLDTEASTLKWKGTEGEEEFHVGTINFSEGSITMNGDQLEEGSFVVDMASIAVGDEGMPENLKAKLKGHLESGDFFDVAKFANITVTLGTYSNEGLQITLNVMGKEVQADVPVTIATTENGVTIDGNFSVDLASVGVPGLQPQEEEDESISPVIQFGIKAVLNK